MRVLDLTGEKYGKLTVIKRSHQDKGWAWYWQCLCECGNITTVKGSDLRRKKKAIASCGCSRVETNRAKNNLIGKRFGRLLVVDRLFRDSGRSWHYLTVCDCGEKVSVRAALLNNGNTRSCGCLQKEVMSEITKQRHKNTEYLTTKTNLHKKLHKIWGSMKERCNNPNNPSYSYYGSKGITYSREWESFENFFNDMHHGYKQGLTLERKDSAGNYCKENCVWADYKQQNRNLSSNRLVEYNNIIMTVAELSEITGINYQTLKGRINRGWSIEKAATTRVIKKRA
ncbi:MAG: hypothetical protein K0R78_3395 [Pelosinus sp.]|jgi:hypothetical protein|nr:hypothetical protein [Pelosinus sp.]